MPPAMGTVTCATLAMSQEGYAALVVLGVLILGALTVVALEARRARSRPVRMGRLLGAGAVVASSIVGGFFTGKGASETVLALAVGGLVLLLLVLAVAAGLRSRNRRRVTLCLLWILPTASVGGYLAAGYGKDDRGRAWRQSHLQVVRRQLGGLRDALHAHRAACGRYPTNDEGLAGLDELGSRFPISLWRPAGSDPENIPKLGARWGGGVWELDWRMLRMHRAIHGRPPGSAEELREFYGLLSPPSAGLPSGEVLELEAAIDGQDNLFLIAPSGVLSPWLLPYVYENRRGLPGSAFADSPVNRDPQRRYSVEVDDGIYLSSVGAELYAAEVDELWWADVRLRILGWVLIALAALPVVLLYRSRLAMASAGAALALSATGGAGLGAMSHITCYIMSELFSRRDPRMVSRRIALLDRYHAAGILNDASYEKALLAVTMKPASRPGSAPASQPATRPARVPEGDE